MMTMEIHEIVSAGNVTSLLSKEAAVLERFKGYTVSFKRYFLSSPEQLGELDSRDSRSSFVIQPVLGKDKIAVWLFLTKECPVELIWRRYEFLDGGDSEEQTTRILKAYEDDLRDQGLDIADHCVRTWFFVDDIDHNYAGVVKARKEIFETLGMTPDTHYLASTGIGCKSISPCSIVQMDALAIKGVFSQRYLYAPANFNPTHEYGVTFERGAVIEYGGKSHVLISGTASINNKGEIVHPGDVKAQTIRMWENVSALLSEGRSSWDDVRMMIVYLRNAEDYDHVLPLFQERFKGSIPYVITHAPVCRPGWLIEMECIATNETA